MSRQAQYKSIGSFGGAEIKEMESQKRDPNDKTVYEIKSAEDKSNFIKSAGRYLVVVNVYGDWCAPCKRLYPHYVNLSKKYKNVLFCKENVELELSPGITVIPTFHFFKNGKNLGDSNYSGGDILEVEKIILSLLN